MKLNSERPPHIVDGTDLIVKEMRRYGEFYNDTENVN